MVSQSAELLGWVIALGLPPEDLAAYRPGFRTATLAQGAEGLALTDAQSGAALLYPPQNTAALVHAGGAEAALQAWQAEAGLAAPVLEHSAATPALLTALRRQLAQAEAANTALALRLAELRAVHEEVQNGYNALRTYVCENGFAPPRLSFINLPESGGGITLPADAAEVLQALPLDLASLCGFSLFLATPGGEGKLLVELRAMEDDGVRFSWAVPYASLTPGWVTFAFEQSGRFWRQSAQLRLRYETTAGQPPLFSLAPAAMREDKAASINGKPGERPLALKAWQSIPGAPLTISSQLWPALQPYSRPVTRIELSITDALSCTDILNQQTQDGFQRITALPQYQRLQVHPVSGQVSVACLLEACPPGTVSITAEAETAHEQASEIEYAIAALSPEQTQEAARRGELPAGIAMSGWVTLPPLTRGMVQLHLPAPLHSPADLYLMTRLPPGQKADYGWAQFLRFSFQGQFA